MSVIAGGSILSLLGSMSSGGGNSGPITVDDIIGLPLNNDTAVVDPTADDGVEAGYTVRSLWRNLAGGTMWICLSTSDERAVWERLTGAAADIALALLTHRQELAAHAAASVTVSAIGVGPETTVQQALAELYVAPPSYMQIGEPVVANQALYYKSDGKLWLARADSLSTMPCRYLSLQSGAANDIVKVVKSGTVTSLDFNFTPGGQASEALSLLFVSPVTAGLLTQNRPVATGEIVQVVGYAQGINTCMFDPDNTFIRIK